MANDRPNILFFFTDDQRFDTIAAWGNPTVKTPTLDSLTERGTSFRNAYIMGGTSQAVCMPSRAMLHTGRTLFRIQGEGQRIPEEHVLLGEVLRGAGYSTYGLGKWHNGRGAFNRAFSGGAEIFFGGMADHWNVPVFHYDPTGAYEARLPEVTNPFLSNNVVQRFCDHMVAGKHSSELLGDAAIELLARHDSADPFFLYLSFLAPHDPRTMPRKYLELYDPDQIELPPNFMGGHPFDNGELHVRDEQLESWPRTPGAIRRHIAEYYAMISHADAQMGRVLEALESSGKKDETIIVFAGDNGLAVGQHGLMGKQNLYEHSVHVPLVVSGPGVPSGGRSSAFCYLSDIFPTLCELAGIPIPDSVEGMSLVPALHDPDQRLRETLFLAYRHVQRAVREQRYKLIEYVVEGRRTTQLFDLQKDPWELRDLSGVPDHAEMLRALREEILRWRSELDDSRQQGEEFWTGYDARAV